MKTLVMALLLSCTGLPAFAGGVISDGGADPLLIVAKPYPDLAGLDRATETIRAALARHDLPSAFDDAFGTRILAEIASLRRQGKFLTLPDLIILMPGAGPEGYVLPTDATWFVSLGAMTRSNLGAHVFFAERVLSYPTAKLANLLLHEILHHVLPVDAAQNERFVEDLTDTLLLRAPNQAHRLAMRAGMVVTETSVSSRALAHWMAEGFVDPRDLEGSNRTTWIEYRESLEGALAKALPPTIETLTVNTLMHKLVVGSCAAAVPGERGSCEGGPAQLRRWTRVRARLFALAELADPKNPFLDLNRYDGLFCKHAVSGEDWYRGDRCANDLLRVTDLFDYRRLK